MIDYEIQKGEVLSKIEKKFKVPRVVMLALNPIIKDPDKIQAGWKLKIPEKWPEIKAATRIEKRKEMKALKGIYHKALPSPLAKPSPVKLPTPRLGEIEKLGEVPKKLLPRIRVLAKDLMSGEKRYIAKIKKETLKDYPCLAYPARKSLEKIRMDVEFPIRAALIGIFQPELKEFAGLYKPSPLSVPRFKLFGMPIPLSFRKEEEILLKFKNPSVVVHELAHVEFNKWSREKYNQFKKAWDESKDEFSILRRVDSKILKHPEAYGYGPKGLPTTERFAYLAGQFGVKSLNDIPESLQKYYEDFFSPTPLRLPAMAPVA